MARKRTTSRRSTSTRRRRNPSRRRKTTTRRASTRRRRNPSRRRASTRRRTTTARRRRKNPSRRRRTTTARRRRRANPRKRYTRTRSTAARRRRRNPVRRKRNPKLGEVAMTALMGGGILLAGLAVSGWVKGQMNNIISKIVPGQAADPKVTGVIQILLGGTVIALGHMYLSKEMKLGKKADAPRYNFLPAAYGVAAGFLIDGWNNLGLMPERPVTLQSSLIPGTDYTGVMQGRVRRLPRRRSMRGYLPAAAPVSMSAIGGPGMSGYIGPDQIGQMQGVRQAMV